VASGAELHPPRLFGTDDEVRRIAAGLLARTLPRPLWTHEGHLAALSTILIEHPEIHPEQSLPEIISSYNASVGGVNDDHQGYHETLTQFWIGAARAFHARSTGSLVVRTNALVAAPAGRRDAPLRHFSPALLFSVEARRRLVEPDLMPIPWSNADAAAAPQL
jgi:hypothetical protein